MQYLFLVVGGELESLEDVRFRDPEHLHFVGAFATREEATQAWRAAEMAAHYRKRNGERPLAVRRSDLGFIGEIYVY
jgi:hypothetical protein